MTDAERAVEEEIDWDEHRWAGFQWEVERLDSPEGLAHLVGLFGYGVLVSDDWFDGALALMKESSG